MTDAEERNYWLEAIWTQLERIASSMATGVDVAMSVVTPGLTPPPWPKPADHVVRDRQPPSDELLPDDGNVGPEPDVQAGVYYAVQPPRPDGMDYVEWLALPLSFRLVELRDYPADENMDNLIDWCTLVGEGYDFDPAEVFVIRDRRVFETNLAEKILRPYSLGALKRRTRGLQ